MSPKKNIDRTVDKKSFKFIFYVSISSMQLNLLVGRVGSKSKKVDISVNDRVSVFLELAEAHRTLDQQVNTKSMWKD